MGSNGAWVFVDGVHDSIKLLALRRDQEMNWSALTLLLYYVDSESLPDSRERYIHTHARK